MYVLIGLRLRCVRYVTLETSLHVSLCLMSFACAPVCPPPVPTTNEKWVGTCPPVPYGFGTYVLFLFPVKYSIHVLSTGVNVQRVTVSLR